ncbi:hypothetical protein O181_048496 [Austropuccinia psidii MF-1]|uniref:Uncharacterized protein n=1 Tax=Austropuccinia psidii MF-1 TaxID=1389203 RepID=A0A9Q3HKG1_9BASI|nr:hypothetical protein [Austropuccinia psidii MF-1]
MLRPRNISLNLWSNAGWGGDLERSQSGFILKLGDAPILWTLKRQGVVALSTCAAEYVALSDLTQHFVQAINQLSQLAESFEKQIFCDNQAAVQVSINNHSRKRMRYLDRAFFFVNDTIRKYGIKIIWVRQKKCRRTRSLSDSQDKRFSEPCLSYVRLYFISCSPNLPKVLSSPLIIGGDGLGTDWRASFAAPGYLSIGNAFPDL